MPDMFIALTPLPQIGGHRTEVSIPASQAGDAGSNPVARSKDPKGDTKMFRMLMGCPEGRTVLAALLITAMMAAAVVGAIERTMYREDDRFVD